MQITKHATPCNHNYIPALRQFHLQLNETN